MNDYLGTTHEAIYDMVQEGEPGQSRSWAADITGISHDLGAQISSLREQCALISSVWSDGVGSVRLTDDLGAVIDYLQVLADGLSDQSASYSNLTVQASADLAAAQPPAVLPPPPLVPNADLSAKAERINASPIDPDVKDVELAQLGRAVAANHANWLKAGETATQLDNEYRTALARLTPPPEPPSIVLDAATAGGAVDPATPLEPGAATGRSASGSPSPANSSQGGWSVDRYLPGGPSAGATVGQVVSAGTSPSSFQPVGAVGSTGSGQAPVGISGTNGVADRTGDGVISAGMLSGGGSAMGSSRPRVDLAGLHGGIWDGSVGVGTAGLGTAGVAARALTDSSFAGSGASTGRAGFDPVTGSAITAGPGRFDSVVGDNGSGWETAAGVGGIAALAAGAAMFARGGSAAVTAAGLSGGFGPGGNGAAGLGDSGSARGMMPGPGSNSMVQGGQIGQTGRPVSATAGAGTGRPGAPGSGIGGEHGYRVTWLVEDRDLYGRGPSVKSVIESPRDPE